MKRRIIDRYDRSEDGDIVVDVGVGTVEDLYDHFDRTASFLKKDLDEDFADYLIECVKEIRGHPFLVRINVNKPESKERMERVRSSIQSYFLYARDVEAAKLRRLFRRSFVLVAFGAALILGTLRMHSLFGGDPPLPAEVLGEGVNVAAWVALWTAFASLIFDWGPHRQNLRAYRRILDAEVEFRNGEQAAAHAA